MLWQVRALLEDRPGAMAALATRCGQEAINILEVQVFPCLDGRVVDELVLHTSRDWAAADVERLVREAGVEEAVVAPCPPHVLEDQPVRYLRAAQQVMQEPETLDAVLSRLLGAALGACTLAIDDGDGPPVRLTRSDPFTDTEVARARELRRLAVLAAATTGEAEVPTGGAPVSLRRGTEADVQALIAMHGRCSAETVFRRFHTPVPHLSPHMAGALLEPTDGLSIVLAVGDALVGSGMVASDGDSFELALVVEDGWQRRGHGTRLFVALVEAAVERGAEVVTCYAQPDNDAVLRTVRRAGLRAHANHVDGVNQYRIVVGGSVGAAGLPRPGRANPAFRGEGHRPPVAGLSIDELGWFPRARNLRIPSPNGF